MPEASRLLATACASKRVWLMPSARTDEPHEEVVERAGWKVFYKCNVKYKLYNALLDVKTKGILGSYRQPRQRTCIGLQ
jgi:hypothetical protein